jgi:hypothetical protein
MHCILDSCFYGSFQSIIVKSKSGVLSPPTGNLHRTLPPASHQSLIKTVTLYAQPRDLKVWTLTVEHKPKGPVCSPSSVTRGPHVHDTWTAQTRENAGFTIKCGASPHYMSDSHGHGWQGPSTIHSTTAICSKVKVAW